MVLSYLDTPNLYAEICSMFVPSVKLIVSERSSHHREKSHLLAYLKRTFHRAADHIVVNSQSHKYWLEKKFRWLNGDVSCIYNGLNIESYTAEALPPKTPSDMRLIAIGRVGPEKNTLNLLKACDFFYKKHGWVPKISWVGRRDNSLAGQKYCEQVDKMLNSMPEVKKQWQWLGERNNVAALLREHHALIHPSLYEGLPNVVCEALAAGRPALVSDVCDHAVLVEDGERGFLFDPLSPEIMANSIDKLAALQQEDWVRLSSNCRHYAETVLTSERMVSEYETLFQSLMH